MNQENKTELLEDDPCTLAREKFGVQQNIEGLCSENLKLYDNQQWVIWENIDYTEKTNKSKITHSSDWEKEIRRVAWFDNFLNFHMAWNKIPHVKFANVMYDAEQNHFNV